MTWKKYTRRCIIISKQKRKYYQNLYPFYEFNTNTWHITKTISYLYYILVWPHEHTSAIYFLLLQLTSTRLIPFLTNNFYTELKLLFLEKCPHSNDKMKWFFTPYGFYYLSEFLLISAVSTHQPLNASVTIVSTT